MITLYQPPRVWGLPNMSPFCVKLETYMRMTKIPYQTALSNHLQAPKGRVPYVEINGQLMGDSSLIIEELKKKHGDPLDQHLTPEQHAHALALQRLTEEHLYFAGAWLRWSDSESSEYVYQVFKPMFPRVIGKFIFKRIKKSFLNLIREQGMGQHSRSEIIEFAKKDLSALSVLLGEKPYFLGAEPTSTDAMMFGFLIQTLWIPWKSPVKEYALGLKNLSSYCERMKKRYWE